VAVPRGTVEKGDGKGAKDTMINALSLESATRFDRNEEKNRIEGLIPNRERDATGTLELGGNLRCKWSWEERLL
jgi:hypothetical protein